MSLESESWVEYRKFIVEQLRQLQADQGALRREIELFRQQDISEIKVEIALLKLKSSLWGGLLGAVSGAAISLAAALSKVIH